MIGAAPPHQMQQQQSSQPGSSAGTPGSHNPMTPTQGAPPSNPPLQGTPQSSMQPPQSCTPHNVSRSTMQPTDVSKEKLMVHMYEYLLSSGASKTAEMLKSEMGPEFPNAKWPQPSDTPTPFLFTWWSLFYDLYCAAPDRRNDADSFPSAEAKAFHDYGLVPSTATYMMNGMPYGAPSPMLGGCPPDIMGFPGGRFPPRAGMHQMGQFQMFPNNRGVMGRPAPPMYAQMRPGGPPMMPPQAMYRGGAFGMDGLPTSHGTAFAPSPMGMAPNGAVMGPPMGGMSSPGAMPLPPGASAPQYMMIPGPSNPLPQYAMGGGGMGGGVGGANEALIAPPPHPQQQPNAAHTPLNNGPASSGPPPTTSGTPVSAVNAVLNGGEVKNSPIGTPRANGGTPGGPGSAAPGSVHSQGGGVGSVPGQIEPKTEPMDTTCNGGGGGGGDDESMSEVAKIKNGLFDDFQGNNATQEGW